MVAVVTAFALTSCSGSGEAGPTTAAAIEPSPTVNTPAATPHATPIPTATATIATSGAPKRPAGMNANTAEGARKTALYFIQLYPYVMRTGDVKEWDRLSVAKKCDFCSKTRRDALSIKKKHYKFVGGALEAKVVQTYDRDTLYDAYRLDVRFSEKASAIRDRAGNDVTSSDANEVVLGVEVMRAGKAWKILEIGTEDGQ
ncbi:hypothetical protein GCM10025864_35060 [Luteimicrobium album]|uniref:DUF6318 domain-containing protein n=1 Tax=Luteimicrobium album TaxID=1054550 RepID=A0ABQ6I5K5_9MICO|nr:hypothetical protein GCM10025864_35060 [Luteimicrobium album]